MPAYDLYNQQARAQAEADKKAERERQRRIDNTYAGTSAASPPFPGPREPVPPRFGLRRAAEQVAQRYTAPTPAQQASDRDTLDTASRANTAGLRAGAQKKAAYEARLADPNQRITPTVPQPNASRGRDLAGGVDVGERFGQALFAPHKDKYYGIVGQALDAADIAGEQGIRGLAKAGDFIRNVGSSATTVGKNVPAKKPIVPAPVASAAPAAAGGKPVLGPDGKPIPEFIDPPAPSKVGLRSYQVGRDAAGRMVASNQGDMKELGATGKTGLRTFAPETQADRDKAAAASEQYYKNIGGGMDVQLERNAQVLAEEAGGARAAAAVGGGGGLRRGSGSDDGSPSFRDQIELAKLGQSGQQFQQTREDTKVQNAAEAAAAAKKDAKADVRTRSDQYFNQLDEKARLPTSRADSDLLAQIDILKDNDADLMDANDPATRPVRENLLQRATTLINSKHTRWTTIDGKSAAIPVGSANLGAIGTGEYRGGLLAFVPDAINDFGGSFTFTKPDGEKLYANADEFDEVSRELLRRAAELGLKDQAYTEGSNGIRR